MDQLVMVEWEDSAQPLPGWVFVTDLPRLEAVQCRSVGWIVASDDRVLMLAPNLGEVGTASEQASGIIRIPKRCVVRMVPLLQAGADRATGLAAAPLGLCDSPGHRPASAETAPAPEPLPLILHTSGPRADDPSMVAPDPDRSVVSLEMARPPSMPFANQPASPGEGEWTTHLSSDYLNFLSSSSGELPLP